MPVPLDCDAQGSSGQRARRWGGPEDSDGKGSLGRALASEDRGSQPASLRVPENPGRFLSECFGASLEGGVSLWPSPTPRGCGGGVTRGGGAGEGSVSSGNPSGPRPLDTNRRVTEAQGPPRRSPATVGRAGLKVAEWRGGAGEAGGCTTALSPSAVPPHRPPPHPVHSTTHGPELRRRMRADLGIRDAATESPGQQEKGVARQTEAWLRAPTQSCGDGHSAAPA